MAILPGTKINMSTRTMVRFWLVPLVIIAIIAAVYWGAPALAIIFIAFFLALIFNRPTTFLAKYIKSRALAAAIVMVLVLAVLLLSVWTLIPLFIEQISIFIASMPDTLSMLQDSTGFVRDFAVQHNLEAQYKQIIDALQSNVSGWALGFSQGVIGAFGGFLNSLLSAFMIIILAFFMLVEGPVWMERYWRLVYKNRQRREHHKAIANKMYHVVSGYINGTAIIAIISTGLTGLGLLIISLILPLPNTVILPSMMVVFVSAFIPMFGAAIAGVIVGLLTLLYSWPTALIFLVYFIIYQTVVNNVLVPNIFSKTTNVSPLMVLLAITVGTYCGGIIGIFIAIPVAGCLQIVVREYMVKRKTTGLQKYSKKVE
jgi:predicted PurR-regulated permease PerM